MSHLSSVQTMWLDKPQEQLTLKDSGISRLQVFVATWGTFALSAKNFGEQKIEAPTGSQSVSFITAEEPADGTVIQVKGDAVIKGARWRTVQPPVNDRDIEYRTRVSYWRNGSSKFVYVGTETRELTGQPFRQELVEHSSDSHYRRKVVKDWEPALIPNKSVKPITGAEFFGSQTAAFLNTGRQQ